MDLFSRLFSRSTIFLASVLMSNGTVTLLSTMPILSVFHSENQSLLLLVGSSAILNGYTASPPSGLDGISNSVNVIFLLSRYDILLPSCSLNHNPLPSRLVLIQ